MEVVGDLITEGLKLLGHTARLDVELLLCHALRKTRIWLFTYPKSPVEHDEAVYYRTLLQKRKKGEPIAYLIGKREFWSLPLQVTSDTLIPRFDTETLVEHALQFTPSDKEMKIADLGCGTGAVALAIAHERSLAQVVATDISEAALRIAQENAEQLNLKNVIFKLGNWCDALDRERNYDLIVSNPPYIAEDDPHLLQGDLRFEPHQALISGQEGLDALRTIIANAGNYLKPGGRLLLEHGFEQGAEVRNLLVNNGFREVFTALDLEQRDRVSGGQWQI